jgi:membrane protease YdiL (CAAX protease family)
MAALAWFATPRLAPHLGGPNAFTEALLVCLTLGLVWQFVLVVLLLSRELPDRRRATIARALWLRAPRDPKTQQANRRLWWVLIPLALASGAESMIPSLPHPSRRDLGEFLSSDQGHAFFRHAWGWYALVWVLLIFNTVLGEELLFRGLLLPRMNRVFGRRDWLANGVLFACYHLHTPWIIPSALLDSLIISYPSRRYRTAWIGIIVHSVQSLFIGVLILVLVL